MFLFRKQTARSSVAWLPYFRQLFKKASGISISLFSGNCANRMAILRPTLTLYVLSEEVGFENRSSFLIKFVCISPDLIYMVM